MWVMGIILGIGVGAGILAFVFWSRNNKVQAKWYEWVIGIIGLLLVLFAIQNFYGSIIEKEPEAANMYLLLNGLPGIVLGAIAAALIWRRQRAAT